jgi:hypothetical protein
MQRNIDRQLAGFGHEMRDTVEKLASDVAAMKSHFDSASARLDASHEKLSVAGKRLEHAESVARMDSLTAEIADLKCFIEKRTWHHSHSHRQSRSPSRRQPRFGHHLQHLAGAPVRPCGAEV